MFEYDGDVLYAFRVHGSVVLHSHNALEDFGQPHFCRGTQQKKVTLSALAAMVDNARRLSGAFSRAFNESGEDTACLQRISAPNTEAIRALDGALHSVLISAHDPGETQLSRSMRVGMD